MSEVKEKLSGPDFTKGVAVSSVVDGAALVGHAHGEPVMLARQGDELFAVGTSCTHYGGPLGDGLIVGDTIRCPWHHACFSLRTGEALRAPAMKPVACWHVAQRNGKAYLGKRVKPAGPPSPPAKGTAPRSVVILGGGAAGNAAAETLRREGYTGRITMVSADASLPCDRPSLSKGYLAGTAPAKSVPLRSRAFYEKHKIAVTLNARAMAIDTAARRVELSGGKRVAYDALLLATGADPVRLDVPGHDLPHVHYLRTFADSRALLGKARASECAVVIGASFIGLEVAAALRAHDLGVHVVAPEAVPMEKILGAEVGKFFRGLHEQHCVLFHLGATAASFQERTVTLNSGERLRADLVVVGVGVQPAISLAEKAGLAIDRGVTVNEYLESSVPGIFAAGDVAGWPDARTGERTRVEHWVVAERQGQTAARNILGRRERFDAVPFFWTDQYDLSLSYVGHAEKWDSVEIDGRLDARDCTITYRRGRDILAVAAIHRDVASLRAEVELENKAVARG